MEKDQGLISNNKKLYIVNLSNNLTNDIETKEYSNIEDLLDWLSLDLHENNVLDSQAIELLHEIIFKLNNKSYFNCKLYDKLDLKIYTKTK